MASNNAGLKDWELRAIRNLITSAGPGILDAPDRAVLYKIDGALAGTRRMVYVDNAIAMYCPLGVGAADLHIDVDDAKHAYGALVVSLVNTASQSDPSLDGTLIFSVGAEGDHLDDGTIENIQAYIYDEYNARYVLRIDQEGFVRVGSVTLEGGARPAASEALAGTIWRTPGGTGVADVVEMCLKGADNNYTWVELVTG